MRRAEYAKELFESGYACSQAVALAFQDLTNVSKEDLAKLTLPLGGGLGRLRLTCGAISGMAIILGLVCAKDNNTSDEKLRVYELTRQLVERFKAEHKTIICQELLENPNTAVEIGGKPDERTKEYYKQRPCSLIVYNAAKVLEDYLVEINIIK
jgi:C_GCAxxG_C_C family probable redox protein